MRMKLTIISASGLIGGMAVVSLSPALAIEPPPDTAEPPAALLNGVKNSPATKPQSKVESNVAFIGLATAAVPEMVADHLDLEQGSGVIVRTVSPDSPAQRAGLSVNDIILSVGETAVGNPEALSSSIRERKPGDRIAISLIHKGKPAKVEVTLSRRPANLAFGVEQEPMLEGLPQAHAERLRDLIERHMGGLGQNGGMGLQIFPEDLLHSFPEMSHPKGLAIPEYGSGGQAENRLQKSSTIRVSDGTGLIELNTSNGDTVATVRDENNDIVWSGPWNSEEDRTAAPDDIRQRIDKVKSGNGLGFSFRFGGPGKSQPETLEN